MVERVVCLFFRVLLWELFVMGGGTIQSVELSGAGREDEVWEATVRYELGYQMIVSISWRCLSFGFLHNPPFPWLNGVFLAFPLILYLSLQSTSDLKGQWRLWTFRVISDRALNRGTRDPHNCHIPHMKNLCRVFLWSLCFSHPCASPSYLYALAFILS